METETTTTTTPPLPKNEAELDALEQNEKTKTQTLGKNNCLSGSGMVRTEEQQSQQQQPQQQDVGICCFLLKFGVCEPPRGYCRFRHDIVNNQDDGITPCCFGPRCKLGHANRVTSLKQMNEKEKLEYWHKYNSNSGNNDESGSAVKNIVGKSPAVRDAKLLRSQLEPWPTAVLRERLVTLFNESYIELDGLSRGETMNRLLKHYEASGKYPRKVIQVNGTLVEPKELCDQLLEILKKWRIQHGINNNTRQSINAKSYMILRSPMEFQEKKDSNNAIIAAKKLKKYNQLWELAKLVISKVDPVYAENFSALAVTYGFIGSPHIDKQNTTPFYGLSLGSFKDGTGGVCVEVDPFTVAHINTKNRLGKVDGRFPHWVGEYDNLNTERYSLIYYSTWQAYEKPTVAYFDKPVNASS